MGKCRFNPKWLQDPKYFWVKSVPNDREASCTLCKKSFTLGTMGIGALESHMKSSKHKILASSSQQTAIAQFCVPVPQASTSRASSTTGSTTNRETENPPTTHQDLRSFVGGTKTLQAEVLWVLKTITDHNSYSANESIGDLFRLMFPDSSIASTFSCGSNKTAYIAKFGLAPFITKEMTKEVNGADAFVVMFDESLNKTTKSKQLDLHVSRIVCDFVSSHGGVSKVPLTQELLNSVSSARGRYRNYLETQRQKKESEAQSLKRKAAEDDLEQLKKRKRAVQDVADNLIHDADRLSEQAEGVQGTKMAELIAKSNAFRRSHKEKVSELKKLDDLIASKGDELRKM